MTPVDPDKELAPSDEAFIAALRAANREGLAPPARGAPAQALPPMSTIERAVLAALAAVIVLFIVLSPWPFIAKLRTIGHACCAQIPSHTIRFANQPMPIDSRNSGIYTGVLMVIVILWLTGRKRAALFVPPRIRNLLMLCVLAMIFDGFNSYAETHNIHTYYAPSNTFRAITGTISGMALAILTLPVFNRLVWREPEAIAIADDFSDLFGFLAGGLLIVITLLQAPAALYYPMSILSILGLILTLTFVNTCILLVSTRRVNTVGNLRELLLPALGGLALACAEISAIDLWQAARG